MGWCGLFSRIMAHVLQVCLMMNSWKWNFQAPYNFIQFGLISIVKLFFFQLNESQFLQVYVFRTKTQGLMFNVWFLFKTKLFRKSYSQTKTNNHLCTFYRSLCHTIEHLVQRNINTPHVVSQRRSPSVAVTRRKKRKGQGMAHSTCAPAVHKSASHSVTITRKRQSDCLVYLLFDEGCCTESNFSQMHVFKEYFI